MSKSDNINLVLGREEVYKASPRILSFKFTDDIVNGINLNLSNMVSAYPFEYGGYQWKDSERLYLCGEFSTSSEQDYSIQQRLVNSVSGFAAKRFVKSPNKRFVRADFASFRLQWMLYVVWQKCKGNIDFRKLLMQVPNDVILVENTTTDFKDIWRPFIEINTRYDEAKSKYDAYTVRQVLSIFENEGTKVAYKYRKVL